MTIQTSRNLSENVSTYAFMVSHEAYLWILLVLPQSLLIPLIFPLNLCLKNIANFNNLAMMLFPSVYSLKLEGDILGSLWEVSSSKWDNQASVFSSRFFIDTFGLFFSSKFDNHLSVTPPELVLLMLPKMTK